MNMTAVEKVLAAKSGKASVHPGDVVFPDPDYIMIHDGVVMGAKRELDYQRHRKAPSAHPA